MLKVNHNIFTNAFRPILISTLATSLLLLAGCTTQTVTNTNTNVVSNTNATVNTNTSNDNTNAVVTESIENTNADQGSEVDTSDWLTYTNDEYGFSLKYPRDWVLEENENTATDSSSHGILSLGTGGHYPTLAVTVKRGLTEEIIQSYREFDAELSPVLSEDTVTINDTVMIHLIKKGIDFQVSTYFVPLKENVILILDGVQRYDKVVNTLIVN